jgi:hypothetical protein
MKLEKLKNLLKEDKDLEIVFDVNENKLIISEKASTGMEALEVIDFIRVFDKDAEITPIKNGVKVFTKTFSAQKLSLIVNSIYGKDYNFNILDQYTLEIKKGISEKKEVKKIDLQKIAKEFDSDDVIIKVYDNKLVILANSDDLDLKVLAQQIDTKYPDITIELDKDKIEIKGE